eukprot:TRINITY_DN41799_c0_g1_i1.p1 TRINITY_DN41799_c0_g1~~TRINITY_DN41799_c0_g1_i1.p1  ORF type:complete len:385 (+),score=101.24 TRINITY_DN41799_c0_g1_i1:29-1183(+)
MALFAQQASSRPRRHVLPTLALAVAAAGAAAAVRALHSGALPTAWLEASRPKVESQGEAAAPGAFEPKLGRRLAMQESSAAAAAALWAVQPEEADAFRSDRIANGKTTIMPKIRKLYQRLEGLRDDLFLQIELEAGRRVTYQARVAEWYSGLDGKLDGPLRISGVADDKFGCKPFTIEAGSVALIARGKCTFAQKVANAKAAGAKSVIVYDEKMSKAPLDQQSRTGRVTSKGIATRSSGDALSGTGTVPTERGYTIMSLEPEEPKPQLDAVMIPRLNGTELVEAIDKGGQPRVLDVKRFKFEEQIDTFIQKDLKNLLKVMEAYSVLMRVSKDDFKDPILGVLAKDREALEKAVLAKDYAEIRRTYQVWMDHLDPLAKFDLGETF